MWLAYFVTLLTDFKIPSHSFFLPNAETSLALPKGFEYPERRGLYRFDVHVRKPLAEKEPLNNGLPDSAVVARREGSREKKEISVLSIPGSQNLIEMSFHVKE